MNDMPQNNTLNPQQIIEAIKAGNFTTISDMVPALLAQARSDGRNFRILIGDKGDTYDICNGRVRVVYDFELPDEILKQIEIRFAKDREEIFNNLANEEREHIKKAQQELKQLQANEN